METPFDTRFCRTRKLLYDMACRVLGGAEGAEDAVHNCRRKASRNSPAFACDGAFRYWLIRILIDEALALLRKKRKDAEASQRLESQRE